MFPTDAKLLNRARERLVRLTKKLGVSLRQSYARVGKLALIKHQRYAHAHQFKRANRSLRKLKTYLGRVIRDIERRIVGNEDLREAFVRPLFLARRVLGQERRQRARKVYSLHAPEVECIGKGKVHRPYEFGFKVSVATTVKHSAGGQFVTHPAALPGNPYDGHTLGTVIPQMQALIGNVLDRCISDAGYRGHNALPDHKFKARALHDFLSDRKAPERIRQGPSDHVAFITKLPQASVICPNPQGANKLWTRENRNVNICFPITLQTKATRDLSFDPPGVNWCI